MDRESERVRDRERLRERSRERSREREVERERLGKRAVGGDMYEHRGRESRNLSRIPFKLQHRVIVNYVLRH